MFVEMLRLGCTKTTLLLNKKKKMPEIIFCADHCGCFVTMAPYLLRGPEGVWSVCSVERALLHCLYGDRLGWVGLGWMTPLSIVVIGSTANCKKEFKVRECLDRSPA